MLIALDLRCRGDEIVECASGMGVILTDFESGQDDLVKLRVSSYSIFGMYLPEVYSGQRCITRLHVTPEMGVYSDALRLRCLLCGLSLLF